MKRGLKKFVLAIAVMGMASFGLCASASAAIGITNSDHDFSGSGWSGGEICKVCHTPHNATGNTLAPLWNHATTSENFILYSSSTLNAGVAQPDGSSKACLSCHDGTVAIDSFGGAPGSTMMTGDSKLGTDLSNDHPISFAYNAALVTADGGLKDPTAGDIPGMLEAGRVQCSSCHDVHNGTGLDKLLVKSNADSALCLTCHNK